MQDVLKKANAELRREVAAREKAEEELRSLNAELEMRVRERTAALAEANADLQRQIAERKRAEEALEREEELMEKLFERIPVMLALWDERTNVLRLNEEVGRVLGWSTEEIEEIDIMERSYPDPAYREEVRSYMKSLEPGWRDMWMVAKTGERVLTSWSNVGLSHNMFLGIGIDVTERRKAEDQAAFLAEAGGILSSSLDYEKTLQAVSDLVVPVLADWCVVHTLSGDGHMQAVAVAHSDPAKVQWARALQEQYPTDPDAPHGTANVLRTGESELHTEITDELLAAAARDENHLNLMRQVGFRSALIVPLKARGQVLGSVSMIWSETNRSYTEGDVEFAERLARRAAFAVDNARLYRQAEEARTALERLNETLEEHVAQRTRALARANEELKAEIEERQAAERALALANRSLRQRNRELQDFAYVASHDLKEPLRKVQTFSGLMLLEYQDRLDTNAIQYLERMQSAAGRMSGLIEDLLAFSKITTAGKPFMRVNLSEIVREVLHDLEIRIQESGGEVEVEPLPEIEADPTQMQQLLQNLISNALKFSHDGVPPRVEIKHELIGGEEMEMLRLYVRDNGIGFEQKFAERIFAPFQRLHGRTDFEGTGIGLAICRRIVERHGGTIAATSEPGAGATFTVTMPVRQL